MAQEKTFTDQPWYLTKFLDGLAIDAGVSTWLEAIELLKARKILDCLIQPGRITAKVYDQNSIGHTVEILVHQFSDKEWEKVFTELSKSALGICLLLARKLPQELEQSFTDAGVDLIPAEINKQDILFDGSPRPEMMKLAAAALMRFCEQLGSDPFLLFLLRGRGKEESLLQLRKIRNLLRKTIDTGETVTSEKNVTPIPEHLSSGLENFYSLREDISSLHYTIRADELPSAILKWLDPVPLSGLEEHVDRILEEAYERITRLAQSFAFGL